MKSKEDRLHRFMEDKIKRLSSINAISTAERTKYRVRGANIYIQPNEPDSPNVGDVWYDTKYIGES